ncbi:MAG: response regulator transcription factor [Pelomonas sp.]|nr:response regulator transcription factor [Roseateles sp.]
MPRALIAEDEALLAEALRRELLKQWPELEIVAVAPHGHAALEQALALKPDILFLDIRMPGLSGLEVATALAEDWPDAAPFPLLVFVTAFDQYALQAFEQAAADYVLKPVRPERLAQTVARLRERLAAPAGDAALDGALAQLRSLLGGAPAAAPATALRLLQVGVGNTIHMVPVEEVLYFEAADKYVRAVTPAKEHLLRVSLRELLPQLDAGRFWQIHRSVIVRSDAIERAVRDESGKLTVHLVGHADRLGVSRVHAHLFKGL